MSGKFKGVVFVLLFIAGLGTGILVERHRLAAELKSYYYHVSDLAGRKEVALPEVSTQSRLMVAIVFGQSNSANYGESRQVSGPGVFNFYEGNLFQAEDPLLGAEGGGGSVWTRLGDMLVERGIYDSVIFVPLGIGSTPISRWTKGGDLHNRILQAIKQLSDANITPTHLLWHQGESDALQKTSAEEYKAIFNKMLKSIRSKGIEAPIYVSVATRCRARRRDPELQQAQRELVEPGEGILPGPDTDQLGFAYRYDGCHFTDEGLQRYAELWYEKLVQ